MIAQIPQTDERGSGRSIALPNSRNTFVYPSTESDRCLSFSRISEISNQLFDTFYLDENSDRVPVSFRSDVVDWLNQWDVVLQRRHMQPVILGEIELLSTGEWFAANRIHDSYSEAAIFLHNIWEEEKNRRQLAALKG